MILSFDKELAELKAAKSDLELVSILFAVLDRGMAAEQQRVVEILRRKAINPLDLIAEIRRPPR